MNALQEQLYAELNALVADLGKDGGLISPSVYDTAQLLRLFPPAEGVEPGLDWLISQQKSDGGWGDPAVPTARDVPTLAAILTIFTYRKDRTSRQIVNAGLEFLEHQADQWGKAHIDTFPIAVEMILPYLINEAADAGLQIEPNPYACLSMLREKKLHYIRQNPLKAGEAPTYSWEALGLDATESLLDGSGGVGHSPAATAAWLRSASQKSNLRKYIPIAERYLECAKRATRVEIPGVVPNVYPITGFEFSYGLYALQVARMLDHPLLKDNVKYMADELHQILRKADGVSFGDFFIPDVDDTSVSVIALRHLGYNVNSDCIWNFRHHDHFYTFKAEFNPSVFSNAHALHALYLCDEYNLTTEKFLINCQSSNGYWQPDKWHSSWRYTTLEVMQPLLHLGHSSNLQPVVDAFVKNQKDDGGWGMSDSSSTLETAYCVLALSALHAAGNLDDVALNALYRGQKRLLEVYNNGTPDTEMYWLGKELYAPRRVNRIYELTAIYSVLEAENLPAHVRL